MRTCRLRFAALPLVLAALTLAPAAAGSRDAGVAALQVALQSRGVYAGFAAGGWGNLVIVTHADGMKTMYAHLATVTVHPKELVAVGSRVGTVSATGHASGPHPHFEVRFRGAAVDPRSALP